MPYRPTTHEGDIVTRRIFSAVLAGQLLVLAACSGGGAPPGSSASASARVPAPSGGAETAPRQPTAGSTAAGPVPSPTGATSPDEQALLELVRAEGTASVIVEVALDGAAEPGSPEDRRLITEAQDDLIAELDPAHVSVQTRFERYAQLTLTTDEEGLLALLASPRVTMVWENESIPLD